MEAPQEMSAQQPVPVSGGRVWKYLFFGLMLIVIVVALLIVLGTAQSPLSSAAVAEDVSRPTIGPDDAPIVIIEYADFQCPFCARALGPLKQALSQHSNRVKLEFRHFPLYAIHPRAVPAGVAVECAQDQGVFWPYHDLLYQNQHALSDKDFLKYARDVGADTGLFWECYTSQQHLDRVNRDYQQGISNGVRSTPTFFVNGKRHEGALTVETWNKILR